MTRLHCLPKDSEQSKRHRLKIINTYEADYKLVLKYFRPKNARKTTSS